MPYKRKIIKIIGYLLIIAIIAVFAYTILYYQYIKTELEYEIQTYGPIGLVIAGFIVDTVGGPLGPEVPVIAGLLTGIKVPTVIYMTIVGSAIASLLVYCIGYAFGEYGALNYISKAKYEKWRRFFIRRRKIVLVLGALTPVPYVTVCLIAGVFKVHVSEFILLAIGARIVRIIGAAYAVLLFQGAV